MRPPLASLARPKARFDHFAALLLVSVVACSTDDGSTGQNDMKVDPSEGTDGADAGAGPGLDARTKPALDGAANTGDTSAPGADSSAAEPLDAGPSPDASGPADPDASAPEPDASPGFCGGFAGFPCAQGEFCNYEPPKGQGCDGIADGTGSCEAKPEACTLDYNPVCGCNGETYPNACAAHGAGISVKAHGACP